MGSKLCKQKNVKTIEFQVNVEEHKCNCSTDFYPEIIVYHRVILKDENDYIIYFETVKDIEKMIEKVRKCYKDVSFTISTFENGKKYIFENIDFEKVELSFNHRSVIQNFGVYVQSVDLESEEPLFLLDSPGCTTHSLGMF